MPIPLDAIHHHANRLARENADQHARRRGIDRRSFLVSACGAGVGRVAKLYPDISFLVYHSGYVEGTAGSPYDPNPEDGIDGTRSRPSAASRSRTSSSRCTATRR